MRRLPLLLLLVIAAGLGTGRDVRAHGYRHYRPYYPAPYYAYPAYGFSFGVHFGYPYGYGPYGPYGWGPAWGPAYAVPAYPAPVGFLDLDVSPEKAEVHIAGGVAGIADNFDGFPDYLAIKPGTRTLTFKHPGYQDLKIKVHVSPGYVHRIRRDMVPLPKTKNRD